MTGIGQRIKDLRKKADLTQDRLADYLGVSPQAVSKWECGIAAPDLSLIAPLCKVLGCTSDELLGIEAEDGAQEETEESLAFFRNPENIDPRVLYPKCLSAAKDYPKSLWVQFWLATAEEGLSDYEKSEEKKEEWLDAAEKRYRLVLEETKDETIRSNTLNRMVFLLLKRGRREEAAETARLSPQADYLLQFCLEGEERVLHLQRQAKMKLAEFLNVFSSFNRDTDSLPLLELQEKLLGLIFPDGNYLYFYNWLIPVLEREAVLLTRAGKEEEAVEKLRAYCDAELARDAVNMPPEPIPYTTPLFDRLKQTNDAPLIVSSLPLSARLSSELMGEGLFEALRGREDYLTLLERYNPGIRDRLKALSSGSSVR